METNDARKLKNYELTELRKRGVSAVQDGQKVTLVANELGVAKSTLYGWLALYRAGGLSAMDAHPRGGRPPKLTTQMMERIFTTVAKEGKGVWTINDVSKLIRKRYHIRLSETSTCRLMVQLGFKSMTPPWWRSFRGNERFKVRWWRSFRGNGRFKNYPGDNDRWVEEENEVEESYSGILRRAGKNVLFIDEQTVQPRFHSRRTLVVPGETPLISTNSARFDFNMLSASMERTMWKCFVLVEGKISSDNFIDFLKRLMADFETSLYLIVHENRVTKSVAVSEFVSSTKGKVQLIFSPPPKPPETESR